MEKTARTNLYLALSGPLLLLAGLLFPLLAAIGFCSALVAFPRSIMILRANRNSSVAVAGFLISMITLAACIGFLAWYFFVFASY